MEKSLELLNTDDLAKILKLHVVSVRRLIEAGKIPHVRKIGRRYFCDAEELKKFINEGESKNES